MELGEIKGLTQCYLQLENSGQVAPKPMFLVTRLSAYSKHATYTFKIVNIKLYVVDIGIFLS